MTDISSKSQKSLMLVKEVIAEAKEKFPVSVCFKGCLSPEERELIEKECRIMTLSLYMDGSGSYYIRYNKRGVKNAN